MPAPKAGTKRELHGDGPTSVVACPIDRNDWESGRDGLKEGKKRYKKKKGVD